MRAVFCLFFMKSEGIRACIFLWKAYALVFYYDFSEFISFGAKLWVNNFNYMTLYSL